MVCLNHSPTPEQMGRAWVEWEKWGWVLPVSEPWKSVADTVHSALKNKSIHSFIIIIIREYTHTHTHTHTAHSLFTENIWTQLPLGREESNSFCCRWSSGEGEQTGPLFTHGKEREKLTPILRTAVSRTWVSLSLMRDREKDHQHHWALSRCMWHDWVISVTCFCTTVQWRRWTWSTAVIELIV